MRLTRSLSHEKPTEGDLSKQNIQDRYHGRNDPVANKIMSTHAANQGLKPPADETIVSSYSSVAKSVRLTYSCADFVILHLTAFRRVGGDNTYTSIAFSTSYRRFSAAFRGARCQIKVRRSVPL
jgi:hypothetical protein